MCITIICFPADDVINFEINHCFLSSRFPTRPKKPGQKFKYLKNHKNFSREIESGFHHFYGLSLRQIKPTFLEGESWTLMMDSLFRFN